jgi:hypothetical protein
VVCALCNALAPFLSALLPSRWLSVAAPALLGRRTHTRTIPLSNICAFRPYALYLIKELPCVLARYLELSEPELCWFGGYWGVCVLLGGCGFIWLAGALPGVLFLQRTPFRFRIDGPIIWIADRSSRASSAGSPAPSVASDRCSAVLALRCALLAVSHV